MARPPCQYQEKQNVEVYDIGRKRWLKAKTLWCWSRPYDAEQDEPKFADEPEKWECELRNGNRGAYDVGHMRKPAT